MIKRATLNDLDRAMEIIEDARLFLRESGSTQWNESGYPFKSTLEEDIRLGRLYALWLKGDIAAIGVIAGLEEVYPKIQGKWITNDDNYLTIHRLAVAKEYRGLGLAKRFMGYVEDFAIDNNKTSIRIDTHEVNEIVNHIAKKLNYKYCGIVDYTFEPHGKRLAYERIIRK